MRLAQPPGVRSCRDGGNWDFYRDPATGRNCWIVELEVLLAGAAEANRYLLKAELRDLMLRAQSGVLTFGRDGRVDQMECAPAVLELRLTTHTGAGGDVIVRLYFTEPDALAGCLLALKLAGKHPGPMISAEQNGHALEASYRADQFLMSP